MRRTQAGTRTPSPCCRQGRVPVTRAQSNSMSKREESGNQLDDLVSTPKMIVSEYLTKHFPLQSTKLSNRDVDALIHLVPLRMCHGSALAACSLEQACLPGQAWLVSGKFLCAGNWLSPVSTATLLVLAAILQAPGGRGMPHASRRT